MKTINSSKPNNQNKLKSQSGFLPVSRKDMEERGWDCVDFAYIIGDAYVDHNSFGPAIISRVLEANGYKVGIIPQPDWKDKESVNVFGKPRLGFLISAGNMDSMVNHYTVAKKHRSKDYYTPGGVMGKRPDYATIVYGNLIKQKYKDVPVIIGGVEASLRRLAHYDYWSDSFKRSVLLDSQADILLYGMGERSIVEVADALAGGLNPSDITFIKGSCYKTRSLDNLYDEHVVLPSYPSMKEDKLKYAESFHTQFENTDPFTAKTLVEKYDDHTYVVQNPPQPPLSTEEFDRVYELPYMRTYHPMYESAGGIDAIKEIKFSLSSCRGCFGSCSFCSIAFHQRRIVQVRSHESLIREAELFIHDKDFKGYINDVGGPTANFRHPSCDKQLKCGTCKNRQCLHPAPCKNLHVDHKDYMKLLRELKEIPGVKKVFVRSGIRFDYLMLDPNFDKIVRELYENNISGQLRVAPEHISDNVLNLMGKPCSSVYMNFVKKFNNAHKDSGKEQYVVPYLMSSHPGSTLDDAIKLAEYLRDIHHTPEQVQDFYPTPMTVSTCMYYTGVDPETMKPVYTAKSPHEKAMQRALMQFRLPQNYDLVKEALIKAGRTDLIGNGPKCLIGYKKEESFEKTPQKNKFVKNERLKKSISSVKTGKTDAKGKSRH